MPTLWVALYEKSEERERAKGQKPVNEFNLKTVKAQIYFA